MDNVKSLSTQWDNCLRCSTGRTTDTEMAWRSFAISEAWNFVSLSMSSCNAQQNFKMSLHGLLICLLMDRGCQRQTAMLQLHWQSTLRVLRISWHVMIRVFAQLPCLTTTVVRDRGGNCGSGWVGTGHDDDLPEKGDSDPRIHAMDRDHTLPVTPARPHPSQ